MTEIIVDMPPVSDIGLITIIGLLSHYLQNRNHIQCRYCSDYVWSKNTSTDCYIHVHHILQGCMLIR